MRARRGNYGCTKTWTKAYEGLMEYGVPGSRPRGDDRSKKLDGDLIETVRGLGYRLGESEA